MVGETLRILVVDDTDGCRELYSLWLENEKHSVETATDGNQALELLSEDFDLVVLDRDMPGPRGLTVAEEIANRKFDCHVVMASSQPADFDIVEKPIDDYLEKPVTRTDLLSTVEKYRAQESYQEALEEFFTLTSKLAAIESKLTREQLAKSTEYEKLQQEVRRKRAKVDEAMDESVSDWGVAFQSCQRSTHPVEP